MGFPSFFPEALCADCVPAFAAIAAAANADAAQNVLRFIASPFSGLFLPAGLALLFPLCARSVRLVNSLR
jgi:hypothetical protein